MSSKILRLSTLLGGLAFVSVAQADRYIVSLKSSNAFKSATSALNESVRLGVSRRDLLGRTTLQRPRLLGTQAHLTSALDNLSMVVVDADASAAAALAQRPEVAFVEKEFFFAAPRLPLGASESNATEAKPSEREITWGLGAVKAPEAWSAVSTAGSQGAGVRVLVIDTGIDRDHADLKENFEEGKNFITSRDPMEDDESDSASLGAFLASPFALAPAGIEADMPYDYYDQVGHGSHVAGTIAGVANNVGVVGVAPLSKILAGRVCGKMGCSSVAIVNAINWAITKKVDVINMSLGGPMPSRAQENALIAVESANIVSVAASGNDGTATVSYPAAYSSVLAVGAIDVKLAKAVFSNWGPELDLVAPGVDVLSSVPTGSGRASQVKVSLSGVQTELVSTSFVGSAERDVTGALVFAGLGKPENFTSEVSGKIALIQRGEIPFADKVTNAIKAGAVAVLVFNNAPGLISGAITQDGSTVAIPVAMIEQSAGEDIKAKLAAAPLTVTASLATVKTDYAAFQGTSMASPHAAGVAALVRGANKSLTAGQVKELLKSTAVAAPTNPDNQFGTGYINALSAVQAAQR